MNKKSIICCAAALLLTNAAFAQTFDLKSDSKQDSSLLKTTTALDLNNQMMMAFFERIKIGKVEEARNIAVQMTADAELLNSTAEIEYKSFYSLIEKEYYEMLEKKAGRLNKKIEWVEKPISDGFYLQAVLDFQNDQHKTALANLQRAIYWNPVHSAYYTERGFMLLHKSSGADVLMARVAYLKGLELADNPEDFIAAMRGLSFIYLNSNNLTMAMACLKAANAALPGEDKTAHDIFEIQRLNPKLVADMTDSEAKELLSSNGILYTYAKEHIEVLTQLADKQKDPERKLALLRHAQLLAPTDKNIEKLIKGLKH